MLLDYHEDYEHEQGKDDHQTKGFNVPLIICWRLYERLQTQEHFGLVVNVSQSIIGQHLEDLLHIFIVIVD